MIRRLLRWLIQIDAHSLVGIFSLICAIVGVMSALQQDDEAARLAGDGATKYASKD